MAENFLKNQFLTFHMACDLLTVVTATSKCLYVFVVNEVRIRKLVHIHVSDYPTATWTLQQFREAIPLDHTYRFLIHDRDCIFSTDLDASIRKLGLRVLKSPFQSPLSNCFCERVIGTLRRKCLDFSIPLGQLHLLRAVKELVCYCNKSRPHMSLGPGIPDPPVCLPVTTHKHRHRILTHLKVVAHSVLGGLHYENCLVEKVA